LSLTPGLGKKGRFAKVSALVEDSNHNTNKLKEEKYE